MRHRTAEQKRSLLNLCASTMEANDALRTASSTAMRATACRIPGNKTQSELRDQMGLAVQGFGSMQTDAPEDGYASGRAEVFDVTPDLDPNYCPRGAAPDGYAIALALKKVKG